MVVELNVCLIVMLYFILLMSSVNDELTQNVSRFHQKVSVCLYHLQLFLMFEVLLLRGCFKMKIDKTGSWLDAQKKNTSEMTSLVCYS